MSRFVSIHLLVLVLIVCPWLCLSGSAIGAPCELAPQPVCEGCHCSPQDEDAPQPREQSEPDCLCRGAIMIAVRTSEREAELAPREWLAADQVLESHTLSLATSSERPHQFPPLSSGWDVRVLTCALLL